MTRAAMRPRRILEIGPFGQSDSVSDPTAKRAVPPGSLGLPPSLTVISTYSHCQVGNRPGTVVGVCWPMSAGEGRIRLGLAGGSSWSSRCWAERPTPAPARASADDGHVGENVGEAHVRVAIAQAIRPGPGAENFFACPPATRPDPAPRISSQICADRPQNFFLSEAPDYARDTRRTRARAEAIS